jgi:hypothetical protein
MRDAKWFLFTESGGWKAARLVDLDFDIAPIEVDSILRPDQVAKVIAEQLSERGYDGSGIMLGLSSE